MKSKFFLLLTMLLIICCQNHTECIVRQWLGKTITLDVKPEMIVIGRQPIILESDFCVLNYVDSMGCVSCKMGLPKWKAFGAYIDSISGKHVPVVFIVQESVRRNVLYSMKADGYYPDYVIVDKEDSFQKKYKFPTEDDMKTFLLDKTYRVIAIGNPINQEKVTSLYVSYITKKRKFDMAG